MDKVQSDVVQVTVLKMFCFCSDELKIKINNLRGKHIF